MNGTSKEMDIRTPTIVMYSLILVVGSVGNLLVPIRVALDKNLRNPTFVLVASLAIADLLFLTWRIPFEILHMLETNWLHGSALCKLSYWVYQVTSYSSAYHLVLLAGVRYYTLVYPFDALRLLTIKTVLILAGSMWAFFSLCFSVLLFTSGVVTINFLGITYISCLPGTSDGVKSIRKYSICYSILGYFLPLLILIVFHVIKAKEVSRAVIGTQSRRTRQMSVMVVVVLLLFGLLLLPVHLKSLLLAFEVPIGRMPVWDLVFRCMAYSNSCINPIVYAFLSRLFRNSLLSMCPCVSLSQISPSEDGQSTLDSHVPRSSPLKTLGR